MLQQNGTTEAHGRIWSMYEREAFSVEALGCISRDTVESADQLASELRAVLDKYGVEVRVEPVTVLFMSPDDQAEKEALDAKAARRELQ